MQELAASKYGKCLSKVYVIHTKLSWECSQGHAWDAKPNNVSNGTWCPICSKGKVNDGKRRTIIDLKNYAIKMSGLCLSDELPNDPQIERAGGLQLLGQSNPKEVLNLHSLW